MTGEMFIAASIYPGFVMGESDSDIHKSKDLNVKLVSAYR